MATGASISTAQLLELRHHAKQLNLKSPVKSQSHSAGASHSRFKGRGVNFEEVRHYQAGDEPRMIDWVVTARTGIPHTKLFREEHSRAVLLIVDQRQSMGFGSRHCFKSVLAAELAGILFWAAMDHGDRVGGLVFNDNSHREIRPTAISSKALFLLHALEHYSRALMTEDRYKPGATEADTPESGSSSQNQSTAGEINTMLGAARRIAKPGSSVFIISDFNGLNQEGLKQLSLIKRHCDATAFFTYDPMEKKLPDIGRACFTDNTVRNDIHRAVLDLDDPLLHQAFTRQFKEKYQALEQQLLSRKIPLIPVSTSDNTVTLLSSYFHIRGNKNQQSIQALTNLLADSV